MVTAVDRAQQAGHAHVYSVDRLGAVRDEWIEWLRGYEWQWFCTFTFRDATHPEAADKKFRVWISKLNNAGYGRRWRRSVQGGVVWCRALEWQKRGVLHYHALLASVPESEHLRRGFWADVWNDLAGFAKVDSYQSSGVVAYVSKYVVKGGQIDLSKNAFSPPIYLLSAERQHVI